MGGGIGEKGEKLAVQQYKKSGYRILERNFRTRLGEIDIIAEKNGTLVFIEVKSRSDTSIAQPAEWVDKSKQRKITLAAQGYISQQGIESPFMRFDVVEVLFLTNGKPFANRIENAFEGEV